MDEFSCICFHKFDWLGTFDFPGTFDCRAGGEVVVVMSSLSIARFVFDDWMEANCDENLTLNGYFD